MCIYNLYVVRLLVIENIVQVIASVLIEYFLFVS